jgi:hypothetical protein
MSSRAVVEDFNEESRGSDDDTNDKYNHDTSEDCLDDRFEYVLRHMFASEGCDLHGGTVSEQTTCAARLQKETTLNIVMGYRSGNVGVALNTKTLNDKLLLFFTRKFGNEGRTVANASVIRKHFIYAFHHHSIDIHCRCLDIEACDDAKLHAVQQYTKTSMQTQLNSHHAAGPDANPSIIAASSSLRLPTTGLEREAVATGDNHITSIPIPIIDKTAPRDHTAEGVREVNASGAAGISNLTAQSHRDTNYKALENLLNVYKLPKGKQPGVIIHDSRDDTYKCVYRGNEPYSYLAKVKPQNGQSLLFVSSMKEFILGLHSTLMVNNMYHYYGVCMDKNTRVDALLYNQCMCWGTTSRITPINRHGLFYTLDGGANKSAFAECMFEDTYGRCKSMAKRGGSLDNMKHPMTKVQFGLPSGLGSTGFDIVFKKQI